MGVSNLVPKYVSKPFCHPHPYTKNVPCLDSLVGIQTKLNGGSIFETIPLINFAMCLKATGVG